MPLVTADLAAQLAQEELNANMMGQSIFGEVGVPNEGDDLNEYLKRLYFAPGMSQRASDLAEMNGIDPAQFSQQQEQIAAETRHSSPGIFEAIGNVGNTFKDNPWLYLAPAAAAGLAGLLGGGAGAATALPAEIEAIASAAGGAAAGGAAGGILPGLGAGVGAGVGGLSGGLGSLAGLLGTGAALGGGAELPPGGGVLAPQPAAPFGADALAGYGVSAPSSVLAPGAGVMAPGAGVLAPSIPSAPPFGQDALGNYGVTTPPTTLPPGGGVMAPGAGVLAPPVAPIPDPLNVPPASVPGQTLPPGGGVMAPQVPQAGMGLQDWLTLGGALAGLAGSNNDPQTTTATSGPPAYLQPYIEQGLQRTQDLYNQNPSAPVTPFSQQTEDALRLTEERARAGSPVTNAAQNYVTSGLNTPVTSQFGQGTNPFGQASNPFGQANNPYLDLAFDRIANRTQNRLTSEYARSGRDVDASAPARAGMLADLAAQIYAPAYESERNRGLQYQQQLTGIGAQGYENERSRLLSDLTTQRANQTNLLGYAPQLAEQDYLNLGQIAGVGAQREALSKEQANAPGLALDQYLARIQGFPGSSVTQTTPTNSNWLAGAAGGALLGNQIGQMWGAPTGGYGSGGYGWGYRP